MSIASIKFDVNPRVTIALEQLDMLLQDYHYSRHAIEAICRHTAAEGTPTGCAYLDAEDEADASMVYEQELPEVPFESAAWDDHAVILDVPMLLAGVHPYPIGDPSSEEDTIDYPACVAHEAPDGPDVARKMLAAGTPAPISGGAPEWSPEYEPYEPTAEDIAELNAWSEHLERLRDIEEQRRFWAANPLTRFNDERTD